MLLVVSVCAQGEKGVKEPVRFQTHHGHDGYGEKKKVSLIVTEWGQRVREGDGG